MNLMEYITDWLYQMVVGVFSELFTAINTLGSDLFGQPWVQQIVGLFSNLGWVLFVVGIPERTRRPENPLAEHNQGLFRC